MKPSDRAIAFLMKYGSSKSSGHLIWSFKDRGTPQGPLDNDLVILMLRALERWSEQPEASPRRLLRLDNCGGGCIVRIGNLIAGEFVEAHSEFDACLKAVEAAAEMEP